MKKILFIDDDENLLEIYKTILVLKGYAVTTVSSIKEADKLLNNEYDKLFIDYYMKDGDTIDLVRKCTSIYGCSNVIILSGFEDSKIVKKLNKLGVTKLLKKPVLATQFSKIIDE